MNRFATAALALLVLTIPQLAFSVPPSLVLKNNYGEQTTNYILGGSSPSYRVPANTIVSNITSSAAAPTGNTYAGVSAKLLPTQLLTGFSSGVGAVTGTDTVLQALQKLTGNTQNKALLSFTSSAGGGGSASQVFTLTGLASSDTILAVTQKTAGANSLPLLGYSTLASNALTGLYSADPGAGAVIVVTVLR